jgi:hypothetical protein
VNVYLRLWLTCLLLSASCCSRLCLFRVLLEACPFCFLQYTALHTFCNYSLFFLFRVCMRRWSSPTLWWSVPHFSRCYKPSPLQAHWGRWRHSCLLQSAYLQFYEGVPLPHPPELFAMCLFNFFSAAWLLFSLFFSFFFLGGGSICPGS